jgi:hypothetical protein
VHLVQRVREFRDDLGQTGLSFRADQFHDLARLLHDRPVQGFDFYSFVLRPRQLAHAGSRQGLLRAMGIADSEATAILRVEKTRVEAPADLQAAVAGHRPGETINLAVRRDDSRQTIKVALGAFGLWEGESDEPIGEWLRRLLEGRAPYAEGS